MSTALIILHATVALVIILSVIWCVRRITLLRMTRWDLLECMYSPIFIIRPDGTVLSYRNALYNTDKPEVAAMYDEEKNVFQWVDESSRRKLKQSIETLMHTRERQNVKLLFQNSIANNDVQLIWYGPNSIAFIINMPVVSPNELKRLKSEAHLLNTMLDNLPIATSVVDVQQHNRYIIANKQVEPFYGTARKALLERGASAMPAHMQRLMAATDEKVIHNGKCEQVETLLLADGQEHTISIHKRLVKDAAGQPAWIVTSVSDISQLIQQQQTIDSSQRELSAARQKVEESNRLKEEFLRNMSIEMRTPLNAINGFSDLLVETEDQEMRNELARLISSNCNVLITQFDDMLLISKIQSGNIRIVPREIDLNLLIEECLGEAPWSEKPQLSYSKLLPKASYRAMLDLVQVRIILRQLINNAIKFTDEGSIEIKCEATPNSVRFTISDTGVGIAPEHQESVFNRFEKAGSLRPGVGLGLTICRALIELMMGEIRLTSTPDKGTTVTVTLPSKVREVAADESATFSRLWDQLITSKNSTKR